MGKKIRQTVFERLPYVLHEKSDNEGNTDSSEDGNLYDPKYISENMAGLQIAAFGFCFGKCYKQDHLS